MGPQPCWRAGRDAVARAGQKGRLVGRHAPPRRPVEAGAAADDERTSRPCFGRTPIRPQGRGVTECPPASVNVTGMACPSPCRNESPRLPVVLGGRRRGPISLCPHHLRELTSRDRAIARPHPRAAPARARRPVWPDNGWVAVQSRRVASLWRTEMAAAMRAASRPTPWICSDDFA
jgi:hypothetical protein